MSYMVTFINWFQLFVNVCYFLKLIEKQISIEEQRALLGKEGSTATESQKEPSENAPVESTESEDEEESQEVSEGLLSKIAESIQIKNELALKVGELRSSPEVELLNQKSLILEEKNKKLEGLKKPDNSKNSLNIGGSISINGTSNINIEGNINLGSEATTEKEEINLEQEAENLLARTNLEILRLEKEELEYQPESLEIKSEEIDLETTKVGAEIEIWAGGMDEKTFSERLQLINNKETEDQDFANKDLFIKFKEAETAIDLYKEQNVEFYQKLDAKQKEIEAIEKSAGGLECPNEKKILGMINGEDKDVESKKEVTPGDVASPEEALGKTATEIEVKGEESKWGNSNLNN